MAQGCSLNTGSSLNYRQLTSEPRDPPAMTTSPGPDEQ